MQLAVNIAVLASIYALIGIGYVLIYRVGRVINLAHGELMMLGGYALVATAGMGAHPLVALAAAAVLALMVGAVVYVALMRRMTGQVVLAAVLCTIALGIFLRGMIVLVWTPRLRYPLADLGWSNPALPLGGGAAISGIGLATILAALLCYGGLYLFFRHSRWGIRMRAVGQNPLLAAQRGIRLHAVYALAWGIATFTGGVAGMLVGMDAGLEGSMVLIGLKAFPAVLVGGLDSLLGAALGAIVVAASEVLAIQYLDALMADVIPFLVLLAMLVVRPWGLFGTKEELERV